MQFAWTPLSKLGRTVHGVFYFVLIFFDWFLRRLNGKLCLMRFLRQQWWQHQVVGQATIMVPNWPARKVLVIFIQGGICLFQLFDQKQLVEHFIC